MPSDLGGTLGNSANGGQITYHGVCLTVWSHADAERTAAIRRTLEAGRARKESAQSLVASRMRRHASDATSTGGDPAVQARRRAKMSSRGPWGAGTDAETDLDPETDGEGGAISESDYDVASTVGHTPGESTLFLPGDTVFWLPYALSEWFVPVKDGESVVADGRARSSSGVALPDLRPHAGLPHAVVGALLEGRAIAHFADQQDSFASCAPSRRARAS